VGRDDVLAILRAHREDLDLYGVESLRLFGSMARGDSSPGSDVDLLVHFRSTPTFSGFMKLRIFLEDLLGLKVDLVTESGLREEVRPFVESDAIEIT
jgi:predicted nucleotidyltransferase